MAPTRRASPSDAEEFIGVKTFKAKGRRVTNWEVDSITEVEPREPAPQPEETPSPDDAPPATRTSEPGEPITTDGISQDEVLDQFTGQQRIPFDD